MSKVLTKVEKRMRRHRRIRAHLSGSSARPRLSVYRSLVGIFAQLIDDEAQKTLVSVNHKEVKADTSTGLTGKKAVAYAIGKALAEKAKAAGFSSVVFDRGGYVFHGRVEAVAQGARDGGLEF